MKLDVLVVGAHPDDAEIGSAGLIARYTNEGKSIGILDLTNGEPTPFGDPKTRILESKEAAKILGVKTRITLDMKNRYLENNIDNRIKISEIFREYKPDVIITHPPYDWHPDHIACNQLVNAAKFQAKLSKTESIHPNFSPKRIFYFHHTHQKQNQKIDFLVDISDFITKKIGALKAYRSQFELNPKNINFISNVKKKCAYFGSLIHTKFAEGYESPEFLRIDDLLNT